VDSNFESLKIHILSLSKSDTFSVAKAEWKLVGIQINDEFDNCPCGQRIKELCFIQNQLNRSKTYVGNVCVNQFIGIETGNLFDGLRRIALDDTANANQDLINHAYSLGYIHESEYKFLAQTRLKRKLSDKQIAWKQKINRRIINQTVVRRSTK
jgi:hypothetical protein